MLQERHVVSKDMNTDNSYVRKYIASWIFKLKTTSRHVQYDFAFFYDSERNAGSHICSVLLIIGLISFSLTVCSVRLLTQIGVCLRCKHFNVQVLASWHKERKKEARGIVAALDVPRTAQMSPLALR